MKSLKKQTSNSKPWYAHLGFGWERALAEPSRRLYAQNLDRFMDEFNNGVGITDAELARKLADGTTRATVGRWRSGKTEPSYEDKDKIARILDKPVSAFFVDPTDERSTQITLDTALQMIASAVKSKQPSAPT